MQQMTLPLSEVENNVFISYTAVCLPKNMQKKVKSGAENVHL